MRELRDEESECLDQIHRDSVDGVCQLDDVLDKDSLWSLVGEGRVVVDGSDVIILQPAA